MWWNVTKSISSSTAFGYKLYFQLYSENREAFQCSWEVHFSQIRLSHRTAAHKCTTTVNPPNCVECVDQCRSFSGAATKLQA